MADKWIGLGHRLDADRKFKFLFNYAEISTTRAVADAVFVPPIGCGSWSRATRGAVRSDREHPIINAVNEVIIAESPIPNG